MMTNQKSTRNRAAIYLRLSRDDRHSSESESILSQRMLLQQFAVRHEFQIVAEYIDDGVSGTKWERDGLQDLLVAVEAGWIQVVLVKDLSRLSRDYIRTGELLERWFPSHRVRLIAVDDGLDTGDNSVANDFSPLRAIMDDWYARDISRKVRAAIQARQQAGICTAAILPYGYIRRNGTVFIVKNQAEVVRWIFSSFLSGMSCLSICCELNRLNIASPKQAKYGWNDATVLRILKNSAYVGELRLHTTEKMGYKCGKKLILPEEAAVIYSVPPVLSRDEFQQATMRLREHAHSKSERHWLSGKVICGECRSRMVLRVEKNMGRMICGGRCRKNGCQNPSLSEQQFLSMLEDAGLPRDTERLCRLIRNVIVYQDRILVQLNSRQSTLCAASQK